MKYLTVSAIAALTLAGCASSSKNVATQYVSPLSYKDYSCDQVEAELTRVSRRASDIAGQLDKDAKNDAIAVGAAFIVWPALFFIDGDSPQTAEYGRLKGEFEALEKTAVQKNCSIQVEPIQVQTVSNTEDTPKKSKTGY